MKKNLFKVLTAFALVICSTFALTGCFGGEAKITAIDLAQSFKTQYEIGETLDVSNGIIKVTYEDDTQKDVVVTESMVSGFNTQTAGQKTMVVTYKDSTKTVSYTVTGPRLEEERYLWYNNTSSMANCIYFYKQGDTYVYVQYSVSNSSGPQEWLNLQDADYLANVNGVTLPLSVELGNDYYYYMTGSIGSTSVTLKINSINNIVNTEQPDTNLIDGFVRYIPAA